MAFKALNAGKEVRKQGGPESYPSRARTRYQAGTVLNRREEKVEACPVHFAGVPFARVTLVSVDLLNNPASWKLWESNFHSSCFVFENVDRQGRFRNREQCCRVFRCSSSSQQQAPVPKSFM